MRDAVLWVAEVYTRASDLLSPAVAGGALFWSHDRPIWGRFEGGKTLY
jgi:hypothetical protein